MTLCTHENSTITFYDEKVTDYILVRGEVTSINEDIEPQPLQKVDIACRTCSFRITYPNWRQTPEPLFTYCNRIYQQEYGMPPTEKQEEGGRDGIYELTSGVTTNLYAFVDYVLSCEESPSVSVFLTGEGFRVDWSCSEYGSGRSGLDWFEVFYQGEALGHEPMYRDLDEDALGRLASLIAPGKKPVEIVGRVS